MQEILCIVAQKNYITVPCDTAKSTPISNTNCCGKTFILEVLKIGKNVYNPPLKICGHQSYCDVLTNKYAYKTTLKDQAI